MPTVLHIRRHPKYSSVWSCPLVNCLATIKVQQVPSKNRCAAAEFVLHDVLISTHWQETRISIDKSVTNQGLIYWEEHSPQKMLGNCSKKCRNVILPLNLTGYKIQNFLGGMIPDP